MKLKILKFNNVKSTNDEAIKLIKSNKFLLGLVSANSQTNGRGTMGKKFHGDPTKEQHQGCGTVDMRGNASQKSVRDLSPFTR